MGGEIEVIQGVGVLGVTEVGDELHVDVFGGDSNVCGVVRFTFAERSERTAMRRQLDRWRRQGTALTYVSSGATIALQDDDVLFGEIWQRSAV